DVKRAAAEVPVTYLVFDLLQLGDRDLRGLPLLTRKALLAELVRGKGRVRLLDHIDDGKALFQMCEALGLEGVVAKKVDSAYHPGPRRTANWIKIKHQQQDDFVVVGWTNGQGSRKELGALELATFDGKQFIYRGRVGTGFDDATLRTAIAKLAALEQSECAAVGIPTNDGFERRFVQPKLVVSVTYLEWTDDGHLRHPIFQGFHADRETTDCRAAPREEIIENEVSGIGTQQAPRAPLENVPVFTDLKTLAQRTQLSNLEKIFWPEEGYTKGDLLEYYASIAPAMLPHLEDRPLMLVRYPDGINGKSFYQWNVPAGTPNFIRTLPLKDDDHPDSEVSTFLIDSTEALLHVINLGCIPLHVLAAREQDLSSCDFLTLDLDPGEQPFTTVVRVALTLKDLLDEIELPGFVKTSGQAGMHIFVPLGPGVSFAAARTLADLLGRLLNVRTPDLTTMERRISERRGRMLIDTGQTGASRTIVAPYSVRAYRGATVSTPLSWEEVHLALNPQDLNINTVPSRVREHGDPMRELLKVTPDIGAAAQKLKSLFGL
ncbi:MAG TPA: DNA ligase D, partial [Polyangiaceae bacterium]|nr:DNA ligase D [Polyangiaceae bacterium]